MLELNNFSSRVESVKMERIGNLKDVFDGGGVYGGKEISTHDIMKFFQEKGVNPDSIRSFLDKSLPENKGFAHFKTNAIEGLITNLSLNEGKQEIISEILKQGPFKNPEDLTFVIARYIQSKMPYDGIAALRQINDALQSNSSINERGEMFISRKSPNDIINVLYGYGIILPDETIEKLRTSDTIEEDAQRILAEGIQKKNVTINEIHMKYFSKLFQKMREKGMNDFFKKPGVVELEKFINNNDVKGFSDYIFKSFQDNNAEFMLIFMGLWGELMMLSGSNNIEMLENQTEIRTMFEEVKTGVCRHYSIIMREVYNEIIRNGEGIEFDGKNTEMIYVLNHGKHHAYNVLLSEGKDGTINQQYLDVTKYIMGKELFSTEKIRESQNKEEVWASRNAGQSLMT